MPFDINRVKVAVVRENDIAGLFYEPVANRLAFNYRPKPRALNSVTTRGAIRNKVQVISPG